MITISAYSDTEYNPVQIEKGSMEFPHGSARLSKVQLIGGGNYEHDDGFYHSDRAATITGRINSDQAEALDYWIENRSVIYFDDDLAIYKGVIESLDVTRPEASITISVSSKWIAFSDMIILPTPPPVSAEWLDVTSDTYWTPYVGGSFRSMTWDGSKWTASGPSSTYNYFLLEKASTWVDGFQPTHFRITYSFTGSTSGAQFSLYNNTFASIDNISGLPTSTTEYEIAWEGDPPETEYLDSFRFNFFSTSYTFDINKIEFYGTKTW